MAQQESNLPICTPVWQYILIMCPEITGIMDGLMEIGWYHYEAGDEAKMTELAVYLDGVVDDLRSRVEALTGWQKP